MGTVNPFAAFRRSGVVPQVKSIITSRDFHGALEGSFEPITKTHRLRVKSIRTILFRLGGANLETLVKDNQEMVRRLTGRADPTTATANWRSLMALAWSHAVLHVSDEARMQEFYTRVLGFQVTDEGLIAGDRRIIFMSQKAEEHHQLALITGREDAGPSNSLAHLAFRVDDLPELRGVIGRLRNEELALRPTSHGNTWSVYFQDPEQNGVEIFCDTPWQVKQPAGEIWDMTLDDDALLAWTHEMFQDADRFGSQEDFVARRKRELASNASAS